MITSTSRLNSVKNGGKRTHPSRKTLTKRHQLLFVGRLTQNEIPIANGN